MRGRESLLSRLDETFSKLSEWLTAHRGGGRSGPNVRPERVEALRRELAAARRELGGVARADLARVRASLADLSRDYDTPPPHTALRHAELEAFRRHLHTTARLVRDMSNLDSLAWDQASEEYERSWAEVEHAFESQGGSAAT